MAQKFILAINGSSKAESKIIDSLQYNKIHKNIISLEKEILFTSKKLQNIGYLNNISNALTQKNDSTFTIIFELKKQIKYSHIYIGKNDFLKDLDNELANKDTLILKYSETKTFLEETVKKFEQQGYTLAKLQLINITTKDNRLIATLETKLATKRKVNQIVLKFNDDEKDKNFFPKNYTHHINKKFINKTFNQNTLAAIQTDFDTYPFAKQSRKPEILLSKDSTKVYVYLEKRKANSFDGFIGLANTTEKRTTINGYLDIQLQNLLKAGEDFFVYWKSDGNDQKTFRTGITLHYLFKTPLGLKAQLHIFKQDSTFQNSKTFVDINYLLNYNTKFYAGIESTRSSDIQNTNKTISDYTNQFITIGFNYQKTVPNAQFFHDKTKIDFRFGIGQREATNILTNSSNQNQYFINLNLSHNFTINPKNCMNIRSQNFYLKSNKYLTNELFRFGGLYSIRGFAENSLQGNAFTSILTEYRYFLDPSIYIHSVFDYAIYKDESTIKTAEKSNITNSIGIGTAIFTKNGLIKLTLTNGRDLKNTFRLDNSFFNISYNVTF